MWFCGYAQVAMAEVVDRVVAVVESEPILASQVQLETDLAAHDPTPLPAWMSIAADPLDRVIDATLLRNLASDVALYQPSRADVDDRRARFRAAFAEPQQYEAFLARHGLDEDALGAVLKRRMVVEKLLQRSLVAPPDDAARWTAECRQLLDQIRPRMRIRKVPPLEAGP